MLLFIIEYEYKDKYEKGVIECIKKKTARG